MEKVNTAQQLNEIKNLMERSSRFISLSGLSGISAGIMALLGSAFAFFYLDYDLRYFNTNYYFEEQLHKQLPIVFYHLTLVGLVVLALAVGFAIFFTTRKAKKKGLKVWDRTTKRMLFHLAIPLVTGGMFCTILLFYGIIFLIAPATLVFYGLALLNASKFTLHEIQWLGISEIILGILGCIIPGYGLVIWSIGFGILHIVYGTVMYLRHERE